MEENENPSKGKQVASEAKEKTKDAAKKLASNKKVRAFIATHIIPIITVIAIIFAIFLLIGLVIFLVTLPGLILGKVQDFGNSILNNANLKIWGKETISNTEVQSQMQELAQYIQNMGYDLQSYGFGNITNKDDNVSSLENNGKAKEIQKIESNVEGKNYIASYVLADRASNMLAGSSVAGSLNSIFNNSTDSKDTSQGMIEIKKGNTLLKDDSDRARIVGNELIISTGAFKLTTLDELINPLKFLNPVDRLEAFISTISGRDAIQKGDLVRYDLDSWTARYGKPQELLLSLHLATMMPDLSYEIATNKEFNTKVEISLQDIDVKYDVEASKDDETLTNDNIKTLSEDKNNYSNYPNWTSDELDELVELYQNGQKGMKKIGWPYIVTVKNHWFYNQIDFNNTKDKKYAYRLAAKATKQMDYNPSDSSDPLAADNISVKLNSTFSAINGVAYQVCEPEAIGPNENIKKIFQQEYYKYDGTTERAKKIENAKAVELGKKTYDFGAEKNIPVNKELASEVSKEKVSFEENGTNSLTTFSMLQNMHTEAADYIYRNLKELMIALEYATEDDMTSSVTNVACWPIKTDNKNFEWKIDRDKDKFITQIICEPNQKTVIAPSSAIIDSIDDDSITLEFKDLSQDEIDLYKFIYSKKDPYTNISADVLTGLKVKFSNVSVQDGLAEGQEVSRKDIIGTAKSKDNYYSIDVEMYNTDKSKIDDISTYFRQDYNSKYEEIMKYKMQWNNDGKEGIDITKLITGRTTTSAIGTYSAKIDGLTSCTIDRDIFIRMCIEYKDCEFSHNAGDIYDTCVDNGINPVWCAAQAWNETNWNWNDYRPYNYWGLGVYSDEAKGTEMNSFSEGTQKYCNNIIGRLNNRVGNIEESQRLSTYNSNFTGGLNTLYDVFSNYAVVDGDEAQAEHASKYVSNICSITNRIFGEYGVS